LTIPGWAKYGDVALYQDPDTPLAALPRSLEIYVFGNSSDSAQRAGVNNTGARASTTFSDYVLKYHSGWWGIPIKPQPYKASFWVKRGLGSAPIQGTIQVALASLTDGRTYATASFPGSSVAEDWKQLSATLHPTAAAPDTNNVFSLTLFVASHDQAVWINLVSLFPPTFKNRPNGLRIDLSEALQDLKPKFIRIPGGCNLQGLFSGVQQYNSIH
jgi:alpha-N-arabinofuranosidase